MFENKTVVVTGGASGIGAALVRAFAIKGANVCIADLDGNAAADIAREVNGIGVQCNVRKEANICDLIAGAQDRFGPIDIFVSNAGLAQPEPDHAASASTETWQLNWEVHVLAHVFAARLLLPEMIKRGSGHLVNVASAAGLLNQIGDAAYSASKHAAVSFAESLAITHGDDGIDVSVVCPQYVATSLIDMSDDTEAVGSLISAQTAADKILEGIAAKEFLILPHPQVAQYCKAKGNDHGAWLSGMRGLRRKFLRESESGELKDMYKFV